MDFNLHNFLLERDIYRNIDSILKHLIDRLKPYLIPKMTMELDLRLHTIVIYIKNIDQLFFIYCSISNNKLDILLTSSLYKKDFSVSLLTFIKKSMYKESIKLVENMIPIFGFYYLFLDKNVLINNEYRSYFLDLVRNISYYDFKDLKFIVLEKGIIKMVFSLYYEFYEILFFMNEKSIKIFNKSYSEILEITDLNYDNFNNFLLMLDRSFIRGGQGNIL